MNPIFQDVEVSEKIANERAEEREKQMLTTIINMLAQGKLRPVSPTLEIIKTRGPSCWLLLNFSMTSVLAEVDNLP